MIRKYVTARWALVIGLFIFMLSIYLFFRPQPPVQAGSNSQPVATQSEEAQVHAGTDISANLITNQPPETTLDPSSVPMTSEVTPEVTLAAIAAQDATSEATVEAAVETETTPDIGITETPIVVTTQLPVNTTSDSTKQVEVTNELKPVELLAVPDVTEPDIELAVTCPSQEVAAFVLRNLGGDMPAAGAYSVSNSTQNQSFQLRSGDSISFEAAGDAVVSADYTTTSGTQVTLGATGQCEGNPTGTATRIPTRTPNITPATSNTPTITRTVSIPATTITPGKTPKPKATRTPGIRPTPTITLTASKTPIATLTFTPSRTARPTLTFTPSNTPTTTLTPTITATPSVTLTPSIVPSATATATLQPGTTLIELNVACLPVTSGSPSQARFQLRNVGGDMLTAGTYILQEPNKALDKKTFLLLAGETEGFIAAGDAQVNAVYSTLAFSKVTLGVTGTCLIQMTPTLTPTPTQFLPSSTPLPQSTTMPTSVLINPPNTAVAVVTATTLGDCGAVNENPDNNFPVVDTAACIPNATLLQKSVWTPVAVGGAVCPDWLIYNTNMTGDWEIFRLGQLPDDIQADPNLSRGVGRRVYDLMPSRSPDQTWIAFASNRDSNWEIYISAVEQSDIQRVTYTPDAVELDPVWSPVNGQLIYESNRDGNWNLYLFDVSTGMEKRLTDWPGNEINAAWSPDGQHMVFQSDGEGFWQIYEMDLNTLISHRLSNDLNDDHGPQFSRDGQHIVFHALQQDNNNIIYIMNTDGSQVTAISDPAGNAINHAWSPDSHFIAYQSNIDGDQDIYVYELATHLTRKLTANAINDYAPTWYCNAPVVAFTSDITGDSNIFSVGVLPIKNQPINVKLAANQLTFDAASDQYPVDSPSEENASRQDSLPVPIKNK